MDAVELALRIAVSATFLLSAAGKTVSLNGSARMVAGLLDLRGRSAPRRIAMALIAGEAAAAGLVAAADNGVRADAAAVLALVLCGLFAGAAVRAGRSGRHITCHCFGSLRPAEVLGPRTLRRALPLAAAVIAWYAVVQQVTFTPVRVAERVGVTFAAAALVASVAAWTHWRHGVAHRRFAADAIHRQSAMSWDARREAMS